MSIEFINFNEFEEVNLFNGEYNWQYKSPDNWVEEVFNPDTILEDNDKLINVFPNYNDPSLYADEGSEEWIIPDVSSFISKETQSSGEASQINEEAKAKKRIFTKVTFEDLEKYVKSEIEREGYDCVLSFWLMNDEEEEDKKVIMRNHSNKSKLQIEKLNEALLLFPNKFPIKERRRLSKEIGLSEEQIYRWYYEHNPDIKRNKPKVISK